MENKKPYVTDEQIAKCMLLGLIIFKPWSNKVEEMCFTATKDGTFVCKKADSKKYDSANKNDYQFHTPQEIIDLVSSGKYFLGNEGSPYWSWKCALEEFNNDV